MGDVDICILRLMRYQPMKVRKVMINPCLDNIGF